MALSPAGPVSSQGRRGAAATAVPGVTLSGAGLQPAPLALRGRRKGASGGPGSAVVSGHLWAQHAYGVCGEGVAKAGTRVAHGTVDRGGAAGPPRRVVPSQAPEHCAALPERSSSARAVRMSPSCLRSAAVLPVGSAVCDSVHIVYAFRRDTKLTDGAKTRLSHGQECRIGRGHLMKHWPWRPTVLGGKSHAAVRLRAAAESASMGSPRSAPAPGPAASATRWRRSSAGQSSGIIIRVS